MGLHQLLVAWSIRSRERRGRRTNGRAVSTIRYSIVVHNLYVREGMVMRPYVQLQALLASEVVVDRKSPDDSAKK